MAPRPKGKSKVLIIVVAVVVVLAAVLIGLYAAGVGPFAPSSSPSSSPGGGGSGGSGETYKAAVATATPAAAGVAGGPWTVVGGSGVQLTASVPVNSTLLNESFDFGCKTHALTGASSITSFPATTSATTAGDSNLWVIIFANATGYALEVAVISGNAIPVLTLASFSSCGTGSPLPSLPSTIVDSPVVAAAAWKDGGSLYAGTQSSYDVELIVLNVTDFGGPTWVVTYTNCNPNEQGATLDGNSPSQFTAIFYADNGTLWHTENSTTACPVLSHSGGGGGGGSKTPNISGCEMISIPQNVTSTYWYNASVVCPFNITKMTTGDVTVSAVNNTTGDPVATSVTDTWSLVVQNVTPFPYVNVSHYNFATNTWNDTTYPILALAGDSDYWVLTTPTNVSGDRLVITATASAPCTGSFDWFLNEVL